MNSWKTWYARYERLLVTGALVAGFTFHVVTFRALDVWTMLAWLGGYLVLAAASIAYMQIVDARAVSSVGPLQQRIRAMAPVALQLSFGSLLSMVLLFYWFSGSLSVSWPVFLFFVLCIGINEAFPHWYAHVPFQANVFLFVLFCYCSVLVPYAFHSIEVWTFLMGAGVSLVVAVTYYAVLARLVPKLRVHTRSVLFSWTLVSAALSALYFYNLIPPVPVSLREAGIYHNVQRIGGAYQLDSEPESVWQRFLPGQVIHEDSDGKIYAYTAIYTPKDLNIPIYHEWQRYDTEHGTWVTSDRLSFSMTGGSQQGYRGYTFKTHLQPGEWRVNVETARGQIIGRIPFTYVIKDR